VEAASAVTRSNAASDRWTKTTFGVFPRCVREAEVHRIRLEPFRDLVDEALHGTRGRATASEAEGRRFESVSRAKDGDAIRASAYQAVMVERLLTEHRGCARRSR
jgi:hypothetical protein